MKQPNSPPNLVAETTESTNSLGCLRTLLRIFTFFIITMILIFWIKHLTSPYLQAAGIPVNAKVVALSTSESCNDGSCHDVNVVRYTFTTLQEQQIQGEEFVDHNQYQQIGIDADWPVVYLRADPATYESRYHAVKHVAETWQLLRWSLVAYLFLLIVIGLVLIVIGLAWCRERYFQQNSILTQGVVTQRWREFDEEHNYRYSIAYTFPGGAETQATLTLGQYQKVKVGATIMVRYLPDNPRRSRLAWCNGEIHSPLPQDLSWI